MFTSSSEKDHRKSFALCIVSVGQCKWSFGLSDIFTGVCPQGSIPEWCHFPYGCLVPIPTSIGVFVAGPMIFPAGGLCPGVLCLGSLCPVGSLSRGSLSQGSVHGVLCPGWSLSRMVCFQEFSVLEGSLSRGISVQEEVSVWGASALGLSVQGGFCLEGLSPGQKPLYGEE